MEGSEESGSSGCPHPSQSECSSSPEPSTSEDAVPCREEDEDDLEEEEFEEDLEEEEELHGEISNPPSPLGGRTGRPSLPEHEVISSSTGIESSRRVLPQEAEPLIDSTVDSSGMSRVSVRSPLLEDELYCQSSASSFFPPTNINNNNDAISSSSAGRVPRKRNGPAEESNGISSSSHEHPSTSSSSSGILHHSEENNLHIGQAFSGIPPSFLRHNNAAAASGGPVTSSHSSILESLSGPLSKRLRTLHHLQQRGQQQEEPSSSPPSSRNNAAEEERRTNSNNEEEPASSQSVDSSGPPSDDPSSSNNEDEPLPGTSYGTFSVTVEPSSLSHLSWNQGGMSRARASLPEDLLFLKSEEEGVFAKRDIPLGHRFGPLEGKRMKPVVKEADKILFLVHKDKPLLDEDGFAGSRLIDVSDEGQSNWLRFVRQASTFSEQNLSLSQQDEELYFTSTKAISPDEELKVWYAEEYAKSRKLPLLAPEDHPVQENNDPEPEEAKEEENGASWPCSQCQAVCSSLGALHRHLNKTHRRSSLRTYKCSSCSRTFQKFYHLRIHVAMFHNCKKKDPCSVCGLKYAHPGVSDCSVKRLPKQQERPLNNVCPVCGLQFDQSATSDLHSLSHGQNLEQEQAGRVSLTCPDCHVEHKSVSELVQHSTSHGFRSSEKEKENIAVNDAHGSSAHPESHKCHLCHKVLLTVERLQRHMYVHEDSSKHLSCSDCGKIFPSNSALICHANAMHSSGKRSYDCPICGEIFDQVIQLKEHVHIHRIDNQYTCPHCYKVFSEYALIRKHIRAFHSEKKFSCPHCDKSFTGADKLKVHLVKHSDVREFLCNECGKQFKRKDKLKEHSKRMHSPPMEDFNKSGGDKQLPMKISTVDYRCFIYKCHKCMLGFKRRGMLVNHLANRHPEISIQSVPELNLPILKATRNYYCQYCNKVYKSSSKRKSHILKNHPGLELPVSARDKVQQISESIGGENPTFSAMVGSVTSQPHKCEYCHKQYASKPKLLQHHRKKHADILPPPSQKLSERKPSSSCSSSGDSSPNSEMVEYRMINAAAPLSFKGLEPPPAETYRLSAAGVAFVPFIPKNSDSSPPSASSESNASPGGFVTIKGNHHLIVEGPSSLVEPSHLEHLINSAQIQLEQQRGPSSSSWMSSN